MTALAPSLARPRDGSIRLLYNAALVTGGSLLIAGLAQVSIKLPFTPVPITGQTLGVLLVGTAFGWTLGFLTIALYIGEIAIGLPFASEASGGLEVLTLTTPSGGYIWGFLIAGTLCGWLANRGWDRSMRSSISVMLLGSVVIYAAGLLWLHSSPTFAAVLGHEATLEDTLQAGLYPFVVGDVLKLLLAAALLPLGWRLARRG